MTFTMLRVILLLLMILYYCCLANKFAVHTSSGRLFHKRTTVTKTMLEETTGHDNDLHNAESNIIVVSKTKN